MQDAGENYILRKPSISGCSFSVGWCWWWFARPSSSCSSLVRVLLSSCLALPCPALLPMSLFTSTPLTWRETEHRLNAFPSGWLDGCRQRLARATVGAPETTASTSPPGGVGSFGQSLGQTPDRGLAKAKNTVKTRVSRAADLSLTQIRRGRGPRSPLERPLERAGRAGVSRVKSRGAAPLLRREIGAGLLKGAPFAKGGTFRAGGQNC